MKKVLYFRIDSLGRTRQWSIWTEKVSDSLVNIITEDGIVGGKLKGSITPITKGLGKNSIEGQAIADAQSVINTKVKQGYGLDIKNLKIQGDTATIKKPMKAETYKPFPKDDKEAKRTFTLDKIGIREKDIDIDRKLDGWRIRIKVNKNEVVTYTSSGDVTANFPQIENHVRKVFDANIDYWEKKYGVTEHILDGEMYRHNLQVVKDEKDNIVDYYFQDNTSGFSATASACASKVNITPIKEELRDLMQFHCFDVVSDDPTVLDTTRQKIVKYYVDNVNVMAVEKFHIKATEENIDKLFKQFLDEGYEGLMIKIPNTPYEFKRSRFIFKYKPLIDEEYKIVGFKKSITGETLGSIQCVMSDGSLFNATPAFELGTDAIKKEIWDNQSKYLGKYVTCLFLNYTDDGKPRHCRTKCFRKGKSKD